MTQPVIVTDDGFSGDDFAGAFTAQDAETLEGVSALDLASSAEVTSVAPYLAQLQLIRIDFPSSADGRGFTLAKRLRNMGYSGRLRAKGHVLADQYAMARRSGFDEVEIDANLAARQPEDQWLARADWQAHDYQARLRGRLSNASAA